MRWKRGLARPTKFRVGGSGADGWPGVGVVPVLFVQLVEELFDCTHFFCFFYDFGAWGEEAEAGVEDDLFDRFDGWGVGVLFGEIRARDLQGVEQQAGAAGVDFVGGDAVHDFADGVLDRAAVFRVGQGEGGAVRLGGFVFPFWGGTAGGVVKITEFFAAQAGAGATAPGGENVTALEALFGVRCGGEIGLWHVTPSPRFRG
jgi:hypothetical protein